MTTQSFSPAPPARVRDPRLDFFRGLGMLIIFSAHMPGNWLTLWIPARFGFSDATEIFVFCSGMASAIAFGRVFRERGVGAGTTRVSFRIWQIYWCHIALFFLIYASMVILNHLTPVEDYDYVAYMNLDKFSEDAVALLPGLFTLTYVPNYFDILPMYMALLAAMPLVLLAHRAGGVRAAVALVLASWLAAQADLVAFPAEPWSDREWFFNPFGWALVFYAGFFLGAGWLRAPGYDRRLFVAAIVFLIATVPFAYFRIHLEVAWIGALRETFHILYAKTDFGILRFVHFMALAYVAVQLAGAGGRRLIGSGVWGRFVGVIMTVGQQSLATFLMGMFAARWVGAAVDHIGSSYAVMVAANVFGWGLLVATAYFIAWHRRRMAEPRVAPRPQESDGRPAAAAS